MSLWQSLFNLSGWVSAGVPMAAYLRQRRRAASVLVLKTHHDTTHTGIKIVNNGPVPVVVEEAGFLLPRGFERPQAVVGEDHDVLEAHGASTVYALRTENIIGRSVEAALMCRKDPPVACYARLSTGEVFCSMGPVARSISGIPRAKTRYEMDLERRDSARRHIRGMWRRARIGKTIRVLWDTVMSRSKRRRPGSQ